MTQQTLGVISLNVKDDIFSKLATLKIKIVYEKQFDLTVGTSAEILGKTISKPVPVYGFILEGSNAIKDWFQITSTASLSKRRSVFVYASTLENAQNQVGWFKNLVIKDLSVEKNVSTASSSSSSSIPIKVKKQQQQQQNAKTVNVSERKPLRSSTAQQQRSRLTSATSLARKTTTPTTTTKIPNSNTRAKPLTTRHTSATTSTATAKVKTTTVTPTKRTNDGMKPANGRRGSLVTSTLTATASKKLLSTTSKGGVIKNTPPVSVLTGRTRKPSRLTEKRPVITTEKEHVKQEELFEEKLVEPTADAPIEDNQDHVLAAEEVACDSMLQQQQIVSYPSTCSSAATDEHDAEVAAATSKKDAVTAASSGPTSTTTVPLLCNSGRSSFSPNSIASLPRPETPEVDQLRLRFETIIQTSSPTITAGTQDFIPKRPSSKLSQHEFISRIKEMKPRGPAGTRVKSMVELFMDENLNKWEF